MNRAYRRAEDDDNIPDLVLELIRALVDPPPGPTAPPPPPSADHRGEGE